MSTPFKVGDVLELKNGNELWGIGKEGTVVSVKRDYVSVDVCGNQKTLLPRDFYLVQVKFSDRQLTGYGKWIKDYD